MFKSPIVAINELKIAASQQIGIMKNEIKAYIDAHDFINMPPKVGYWDERHYPIFATYNMSNPAADTLPGFLVTDASGKEIHYYTASNGKPTDPFKLYRAYRYNDNSEFTYENTPVRSAYLTANDYYVSIVGAGNEFVVVQTSDSIWHLINTKGQDYVKWTTYKDISSIMTGKNVHQVLWFKEQGTLCVYHVDNKKHYMCLFNDMTLTPIKENILLFDDAWIDFGTANIINSFTDRYVGTLLLNKKTNQLVVCGSYIVYQTPVAGGRKFYNNYYFVQIYEVNENFLRTGVGTYNPVIPTTEYKWNDIPCRGLANMNSGMRAIYDDYEECIRMVTQGQNTYYEVVYRMGTTDRPMTGYYFLNNLAFSKSIVTPDACPWAKRQIRPVAIMDGNLYFNAESLTYGTKTIGSEYETDSYEDSSYLKLRPGRWWISSEIGEDNAFVENNIVNIQTQRISDSVIEWHYCVPGQSVKKVAFSSFTDAKGATYNGKRFLEDTAIQVPAVPARYTYCNCCYNRLQNTFYYCVSVQLPVPMIKMLRCGPSRTFEEFDATVAQPLIDSCITTNGYFTAGRETNMLIDKDGSIYFTFNYSLPGGQGTKGLKVNTQTMEITSPSFNTGPYWGCKFYSYDPHFGYVVSVANPGYSCNQVVSSKPAAGTGAEYTVDQFFAGTNHRWNIALNSATGLVAYTQTTPIFIGGRYEIVPPQSIALQANADNHIFVKRDTVDGKLKIANRTTSALLTGEASFDTILVATIVTDASNPISTVYYDIT